MNIDKPLPQNIEAEQTVLGAILIDRHVFNQIAEILVIDDFYKESHKKIYREMIEMNRENAPIDTFTIYDQLKDKGNIWEEIGGSGYITYLTELVPSTENVEYYAKLVKKDAIRRNTCKNLVNAYTKIIDGKVNPDEVIENLNIEFDNNFIKLSVNNIPLITADELSKRESVIQPYYVDDLIPKGAVIIISAPPRNI